MAATKKKQPGVVKTEADAKAALLKVREIQEQIAVLYALHGITDLENEITVLKQAATAWAVENDKDTIGLGGKLYARLRRDKYGGTWVATDDDLTNDTPVDVMPLRLILKKKFGSDAAKYREVWNRVTKRTVDPEKLDRVVQEGILTAEEVSPAFFEKDKKPFIQIYGG